jgi:hypothetical protein
MAFGEGGEWRSLVAHLLWEQRVAGSNPVSPTTFHGHSCQIAELESLLGYERGYIPRGAGHGLAIASTDT